MDWAADLGCVPWVRTILPDLLSYSSTHLTSHSILESVRSSYSSYCSDCILLSPLPGHRLTPLQLTLPLPITSVHPFLFSSASQFAHWSSGCTTHGPLLPWDPKSTEASNRFDGGRPDDTTLTRPWVDGVPVIGPTHCQRIQLITSDLPMGWYHGASQPPHLSTSILWIGQVSN